MRSWPTWPNSTSPLPTRSNRPLDHHLLDLGDRLRRIEMLGAGLGAVHDGVPAIGLQQDGRAEIALAVPPVGRARGRAAEAEDALPQAVELGALLGRLQALARRRLGRRLDPWFDRGELGVG